ncbi:pyridoxamine 5'-phosphate oxidase family protein [Butyrivibrio sp. AE3003]|uniref:pyridoxamine 5'-phosphate oxidase family protein n=1 Tax=Butyrivibrio sp. AE3003 TaxID=1496721 RepID=UPI00047D6B60|nr:pyridoxamine 5'-phosphate oxidase family protein [Butyrivibrio sp. AE3003]
MNYSEIKEIISKVSIGYLATYDLDRETPRVRAVDAGTIYGDCIYVSTFHTSNKVRELDRCNSVEIFYSDEKCQIRVAGEAEKIDDLSIRERFLEDNSVMKNMFSSADNDIYILYKVTPRQVRYMPEIGDEYEEIVI